MAAVEAILADLGLAETRRILVMNKIDLLLPEERAGALGAATAVCRWWPCPRRTARRRRRCWRRSRRRCGAAGSGTVAARRPTADRGAGRHEPARRGPPPSRCCWACSSWCTSSGTSCSRSCSTSRCCASRSASGPKLFGFTCGETEYRLSLIPLGGYVRLLGEDPGEPIPPNDRPRALAAKPLWQRYTVVDRRAGVQPAAAAVHLLHPLRRPAHAAAADDRDGAARPARRDGGPAARRSGRDRRRPTASATGRSWSDTISRSAGKTLRFAIRRGPDAEERDVTPIEIERVGPVPDARSAWAGSACRRASTCPRSACSTRRRRPRRPA